MFSDIGSLPMSMINDLRRQVSAERDADKSTYKNRKGWNCIAINYKSLWNVCTDE